MLQFVLVTIVGVNYSWHCILTYIKTVFDIIVPNDVHSGAAAILPGGRELDSIENSPLAP
jgi:hypothetical protein